MPEHLDPALTDQIEELHLALLEEDAEYRLLWAATTDKDAVEGTCLADDFAAALLLRGYAKRQENADVARTKLATLVRSLHVILKRYGKRRGEV